MLKVGAPGTEEEEEEEEESMVNEDYHYHINFKYTNDTLLLW
jgi:hypothetical protein